MRPIHRALASVLCVTALGWGLAACGGSSSDDAAPTSTAPVDVGDTGIGDNENTGTDTGDLGDEVGTEAPSSTALPDDACTLLGDAAVEALLGTPAEATEGVSSLTEGTPQFVSCYWGDFTTDTGVVSVAASVPADGIDYLGMLAEGAAGTGTPVDVGEDGELLDLFVMPGGGGAGASVLFRQDGLTVVVARSGEAVDTSALESAAAEVSSRL
jgi:hypothetical protein